MVTKSEKERLAVMEEQLKQNIIEHQDIKNIVLRVEKKIDRVVDEKLDKKVFEDYKSNSRSWVQWIPAIVSAVVVVIMALMAFVK